MIPLMVWAAAGAGHVDDAGVWKSARIADPMDLAETLTTEEEIVMGDAVVTMLKNMMPAAIETKPKATGELTPAAE
jgi:hypothetical protein